MTATPQGKTRPEARHRATVFWQKARRFAHAAHTNAEQGEWDPAVANAVNAVINLTDALCVHYIGRRSAGDSHFEVLNLLAASPDMAPDLRSQLSRHLESLLNVKGIAQYEGRLLEASDATKALKHMDRAFEAADGLARHHGWPRRD